jgi:ATP-dependent Clp protease ATP-binding subunit ClpA
MPKINVYLPEDLAKAVREAGVPVSPVCQRALAEAVRKMAQAKKAVEAIRDPGFDPETSPRIGKRLLELMTPRLKASVELARRSAGFAEPVSTSQLMIGILDQGDNLAVRILEALEVDPDGLREATASASSDTEGGPAGPRSPSVVDPDGSPRESDIPVFAGLTMPARMAVASAFEAALDLGHNYIGCEHLLVGLLDPQDGAAAQVLREFGVDKPAVLRAARSAVAGASHMREVQISEVLRRLGAIERRLASLPGE